MGRVVRPASVGRGLIPRAGGLARVMRLARVGGRAAVVPRGTGSGRGAAGRPGQVHALGSQ